MSKKPAAKAGVNQVPALIAAAGDRAAWRFVEFFTANIRNPNTRRAYGRAVGDFFHWCEARRIRDINRINPTIVAAFVEQRGQTRAKPSVKLELAALRMLFDWLVVGQVVPTNPAHSVRGPKHVVKLGKTPVLTREETRELLDAIEIDTIRGLRDRALIGVLVYSFARIGAALAMKVDDYFSEGKRWKLRQHEKGGKEHVVPVHHTLEAYLDAYLAAAGIRDQNDGPLFQTLSTAPGRPLSLEPMTQPDAWRMTCPPKALAAGGSAGAHGPPASRRRSACLRRARPACLLHGYGGHAAIHPVLRSNRA